MAVRKSTGPSRRQAVLALGAGLIGGTIDLSAGQQTKAPAKPPARPAARKPGQPDYEKRCANKPTTEDYVNNGEKLQLQLSSCCQYVDDVLNHGYPNARPGTKAALKRFMTLLAAEEAKDGFLDYCFIQFDIKQDKIDQVRNTVTGILRG